MTDHLDLLFSITDEIQELDMVQSWISNARMAAPTNQVVQLSLDRQQADVDRKRHLLKLLMLDISSRN
jgi:hypothetical protein